MSSFISNENTPLSITKTLLTKSSQSHFDLQTLQSLSLNSSHQQIIRDYTLLKQLGKGAYASVYLCQHNKSKKLYAMKIIDKFFLSQHNKTNDVLIEKAMLSSINHSNIIKLIQTFQSKSKLFFILELATNSTLDVLIEKYPFVLSHKCIKTFCFQIAKALKYLHMKKLIVHRDIKPANICLDENYNVKLIDFASGTEIGKVFNAKNKCFEKEKEDVNYIKEPIGSYEYVSPEMLNCVCMNQSCNDIWSFGCLVYQLYHKGKTPFKSYCQYDTLKNIKENKQIEFDVNIPLDAKDLIMKCLQFDYKIRINIEDVLSHEYFSSYNENEFNIKEHIDMLIYEYENGNNFKKYEELYKEEDKTLVEEGEEEEENIINTDDMDMCNKKFSSNCVYHNYLQNEKNEIIYKKADNWFI